VSPFELTTERLTEVPTRLCGVAAPRWFATHKDRARNPSLALHLKENGIEVAFRRGELRLCPHLYNSQEDLDRTLTVLNNG
jgi:selenocysteine lyase/cysteine desulfurase